MTHLIKLVESRDFIQLRIKLKKGESPSDTPIGVLNEVVSSIKKHEELYKVSKKSIVINCRPFYAKKLMELAESETSKFTYKGYTFTVRADDLIKCCTEILVIM